MHNTFSVFFRGVLMISAVTLAIPVVFPHVSIVQAWTRENLSLGFTTNTSLLSYRDKLE